MAKKKFYVVWEGRKKGIFNNWNECLAQVDGFEGAKYKSFESMAEAKAAYEKGFSWSKSKSGISKNASSGAIIQDSYAVDAACSGNPGVMEYRGVHVGAKKQIFHQGPFPVGTNNIGEFLAIVHALAMLKKTSDARPIYSDSGTALAWVRNKKAKTTLERNAQTEELWQLIERAENWLKENSYPNKIYKWETEKWGEIPADFGRK